MEKYFLAALLLFLVILVAGCTQAKEVKSDITNFEAPFVSDATNPLENPTAKCINLCKDQRDAGTNLSASPCLSNEISAGWVCDVAHDPREDIDNKPANQCAAFNNGTARHFVEVDTDCNLIRTR